MDTVAYYLQVVALALAFEEVVIKTIGKNSLACCSLEAMVGEACHFQYIKTIVVLEESFCSARCFQKILNHCLPVLLCPVYYHPISSVCFHYRS